MLKKWLFILFSFGLLIIVCLEKEITSDIRIKIFNISKKHYKKTSLTKPSYSYEAGLNKVKLKLINNFFTIENVQNKNEIIITNKLEDVYQNSQGIIQKDIWNYSIFSYSRQFNKFKFGLKLDQSSRFDETGIQYQTFFNAKINDLVSLYFCYGYSSSNLFPSSYYSSQIYLFLPKNIKMSVALNYYKIQGKDLWMNGYAFENAFKKFVFTLGFDFYLPNSGDNSLNWKISAKYLLNKKLKSYIGIEFEDGNIPALDDINAVGFMSAKTKSFQLFTQFNIHHNIYLKVIFGQVRENFPSNLIRKKLFSGIQIKFQW